jgi:2-polyprenyl-3-methyl-5-hydroxy-6-metoxy-1,4-benzoquinol methylase
MIDRILNLFNPQDLAVVPMSESQISLVEGYNEKAKTGVLEYKESLCLCKQQVFVELFKYDRHGLWNPVGICQNCGLIYNSLQLTAQEYSRFYSSDEYRKVYQGEAFLEAVKEKYKDSNHIFDDLNPIIKKRGLNTILEVGCGGGWNLIPFKNSGYSVTGIDYSEGLTELGRSSYGLNLRHGSIVSLGEVQDKYDVIISNHVLEHSTDFFNDMGLLKQHLNENGVIYIGVPNIDFCSFGQFQNAHVLYFTPRTFSHYMSEAGLNQIAFGPAEIIHMYGIFEIAQENSRKKVNLGSEYARMTKTVRLVKLRFLMALFLKMTGLKKYVNAVAIKHYLKLILKRLNIIKSPV